MPSATSAGPASGCPKPEATQRIILAAMRAARPTRRRSGVWDPSRQVLRAVLNVGDLAEWEEEEPADEVYEADQSTWLAGMTDGLLGAVLCLDDPDLAADDREYLELLGKHSSISVPLLYAGEWWGELFVVATPIPRVRSPSADLDWVSAVAAQVSAALESVDHADAGRAAGPDRLDDRAGEPACARRVARRRDGRRSRDAADADRSDAWSTSTGSSASTTTRVTTPATGCCSSSARSCCDAAAEFDARRSSPDSEVTSSASR